jgi:hypothetical protein
VTPARDSAVWLRLMLVAFLANGIGPFGLKILTERGLATQYQAQYLLYWYLGACVFAFAALWRSGLRPTGREVGLGALMAHGMPGHVAFPITTGGSLLLVAAAGLLLFREKIGAYGIAGMVLGIMALVGLSIG